MKRLSVIVPVFNAEKWIRETLDSLVTQTYKNMEVICVDDGSGDSSCAIIEEYQRQYSTIKLVSQKNSGVCAARNTGIAKATGEYIAFMDSDDYVERNMYQDMIEKLESDQSDIVFCEFVRFWADGHKQYTVEESFSDLLKNPHDIRSFLYSTESCVKGDVLYTKDIHGSSCRSVFKRSVLCDNNILFHTDLRFAEDQIFVLEYLNCCTKVSYIPEPFVWYRGWTKKNGYHRFYTNHMNLVKYQEAVIHNNSFYTESEKNAIIGYLQCSTYFMIVNDEFTFNPGAVSMMREYSRNKEFNKMLTLGSFIQKYKIRPEPKRIFLFFLLKLGMWETVKLLYPNKKY